MGATKIVNVLKGDSLEELLDIVQSTPSEEVIFILPKKAKAFSSEEHFAQLSAITEQSKKRASFMTPDSVVAAIARDAGFEVLAGSGRASSTSRKVAVAKKEPVATAAVSKSLIEPDDEEQFDSGVYASEDDAVVGTSDEETPEEKEDDEENIEKVGMHIDEGEEEEEVLPKKEEDDLEDEEKELDEEDEEDKEEELEDDEELGLNTADEASSEAEEPIATFAQAGRNLEGFAKMPSRSDRLKIPKIPGRELRVDVRNPQVPESAMEDIEEVWKNENAEEKGSLWKSLRSRKPSWWSRLMMPKQASDHQPSISRWSRNQGGSKPTRRWILIGSAAIVAVIILLFFFVAGNVRVIIHPASSPLNAQFKASIS
ncbi:MAG: hypothetical protein AAB667_02025, partial [Patescibacteria group bacterium]